MEIGEPPPDPFAGMTPHERKRAHETVILQMAYDLSDFHQVSPRERPDFALTRREVDKPFGVEVTQLFRHQSQARLNLVPGYMHRLWSGGSHLHKKDVKALQSVKVKIEDKHGNVRHTDVPAIIMEAPTVTQFRSALGQAIRMKTARQYDSSEFDHLNLVVLDWFHLKFDANEYLTDRFFDEEVRVALRECPFREVLLLIYDTVNGKGESSDESVQPDARIIRLQQLLAMERFYVTTHLINKEYGETLRDVATLNRLAIDHVTRVQGYGEAVEWDGRPLLRYCSTLIEVTNQGMRVYDLGDYELEERALTVISDRLEPDVEERVTAGARASVFGCGFAPPANSPDLP
ncbi:hypothetical protein ABZ744_21395 [Micromonospora chersina]|uniref:hypothetical protein n=1 Tax=Micromonospora chersina TaxID=47854 RepID=UPI0033E5E172